MTGVPSMPLALAPLAAPLNAAAAPATAGDTKAGDAALVFIGDFFAAAAPAARGRSAGGEAEERRAVGLLLLRSDEEHLEVGQPFGEERRVRAVVHAVARARLELGLVPREEGGGA